MRKREVVQTTILNIKPSAAVAFEDSSQKLEEYLDRHLSGDRGELPESQQWGYTLEPPGVFRRREYLRSVFRLKNGALIAFETSLPNEVTDVQLYRDGIWKSPWW